MSSAPESHHSESHHSESHHSHEEIDADAILENDNPFIRALSKKLSTGSLASLKRALTVKDNKLSTIDLEKRIPRKNRFEYRKQGLIPKQEKPVTSMHEYFLLCDREMALIFPSRAEKVVKEKVSRQIFRRTSIVDVRVPMEDRLFMSESRGKSPPRDSTHA